MSLLLEAFESCTILDKKTESDGRGGVITTWKDGAEFKAAVVFNSSMEAKIAESQGVKSLYKITTTKSVILQYHDVFRRESDGKVFRVTSDGKDNKTPASASLDMRVVDAEEYVPTGEIENG